jgi:glycerophosphoryl diester phosphodiesterase
MAQIAVIGFSRETMKQLKAELPELEVCWIRAFRRSWRRGRWSPSAEELIAGARAAGLDGVDLDARGPVNGPLVEKLKAAGLKVYVWTVDSAAKARKLAAAGVDGITTNRPGWLREKLRQTPAKQAHVLPLF